LTNNMSDDEGVAFRSTALDVVGSWLLGGDDKEDDNQEETQQQTQRRPVTLYRPSGKSLPSLTRPNAAVSSSNPDATLTQEEREMKRKLLRKPRGSRAEEAAKAEQEAREQQDEAQEEEEQALVRIKAQASDKKRKRSAQDELLDKLREEAARKKAKNLKRKLQLQRKKQQQRVAAQ
jgi:hypothetical protein